VTLSGGGQQSLTFQGTSPIVGPGTIAVGGTVIYSCPTCKSSSANVANSGTPTATQIASWVDATHI